MNHPLKIWKPNRSWEEAEAEWDAGACRHREKHPLKSLTSLPRIPGMTPETAKGLKWKSAKYLLSHDENRIFLRYFFKHPLKYSWRWIKSTLKKKSFTKEGDFFLYGVRSLEEFTEELKKEKTLFVAGFSYCHKPIECPSGRFSDNCAHDPEHPVCRQCFIGKTVHALPEKAIPLFIPTVHYIGEKMFELVTAHPDKQILFLITACEMTLEMFSDWGNMIGIRGIGIRLDGRICNTMRAFELSEKGIKPGLTVVLPETQQKILSLLKILRSSAS